MIMEEAVHEWGQGAYGLALYFPLSFTMNLKLLGKRSIFKVEFDMFKFLLTFLIKLSSLFLYMHFYTLSIK